MLLLPEALLFWPRKGPGVPYFSAFIKGKKKLLLISSTWLSTPYCLLMCLTVTEDFSLSETGRVGERKKAHGSIQNPIPQPLLPHDPDSSFAKQKA